MKSFQQNKTYNCRRNYSAVKKEIWSGEEMFYVVIRYVFNLNVRKSEKNNERYKMVVWTRLRIFNDEAFTANCRWFQVVPKASTVSSGTFRFTSHWNCNSVVIDALARKIYPRSIFSFVWITVNIDLWNCLRHFYVFSKYFWKKSTINVFNYAESAVFNTRTLSEFIAIIFTLVKAFLIYRKFQVQL